MIKTKIEVPSKVEFNFQEIKSNIETEVSKYKGMVYDLDTIPLAKKDKAKLNKLSKQLNDERIKLEKEYMKPFKDFKTQVKQLTDMIKDTSKEIDLQVKNYEEQEKELKKDYINDWFKEELSKCDFDIKITQIFNDKWLNKSKNERTIRSEIQHLLMDIENDIKVIKSLNTKHESVLMEEYLKDLNLVSTIELKDILDKANEDKVEESKEIEEDIFPFEQEETKEYIINVRCTPTQLDKIQEYLRSNNINYLI